MAKLTPLTYQNIEDSFIKQYKKFYTLTEDEMFVLCKQRLLNEEYPIEFFLFLNKTYKLARYAVILSNLDDSIYNKNAEMIYNGAAWFKVVYGSIINAYVHRRVRDKNVEGWLSIHKEWDKYRNKHHLKNLTPNE